MNIAFVGVRENELTTVSAPKRVANALFNRLRNDTKNNYYFFSLDMENETNLVEDDDHIVRSNLNNLEKFIIHNKIDIVYFARYYSKIALKLIFLKQKLKFKLVYTAHGIVKKEHKINKSFSSISTIIELFLLKSCDKIVVVSEDSKKQLLNYYSSLNNSDIEIIPNGVTKIESDKNFNFKKELGITNNKKNILTIGIRKIKNIEKILKSFTEDEELYNAANLIIIGETKTEYGKEIIKQYGHYKNVIFKEYLNPSKLFTIYENIDLYIQISEFETFGISIIEALLNNKKAIISKNLPISKYFNEEEIYFYNPAKDNLSQCILSALNDSDEKNIKASLKSKNLFNWSNISDLYKRIFQNV